MTPCTVLTHCVSDRPDLVGVAPFANFVSESRSKCIFRCISIRWFQISHQICKIIKKKLLGKPRNDFQGHGPSKASERLQNFEIFWNFDFGFWICVYALCGVKKVLTFILKILTVYSLEAFEKWHWFYYGHIFRIFFLKILQIRCDIWNQCIKMHLNCSWSVTLKTNW